MTFKFVCFDGIKGKELADEVVRENEEKKKRKRALWNVLEFGGSGREKREKKEKKKKRVRVHVWRRKKEGGKKERKRKLYG